VELFRQRADAIAAGFDATIAYSSEVCGRLDSAAACDRARRRAHEVALGRRLLDRLDQRLPLLTSRRRDVDDRQRTLRATIEWSHDLLSDDEKEWFACVSVFAGSFDVAAAEQVCDADVDALESLVDKSLLRITSDGPLLHVRNHSGVRGKHACFPAGC
jgi:predicted ATPase